MPARRDSFRQAANEFLQYVAHKERETTNRSAFAHEPASGRSGRAYTPEEIISILREIAERDQMIRLSNTPDTVQAAAKRLFGSLAAAAEAAGVTAHVTVRLQREPDPNAWRAPQAARELGLPYQNLVRALRKLDLNTTEGLYMKGSTYWAMPEWWRAFRPKVSVRVSPRRRYSGEDVLAELRSLAQKEGTIRLASMSGTLKKTAKRLFGSLAAAADKAGVPVEDAVRLQKVRPPTGWTARTACHNLGLAHSEVMAALKALVPSAPDGLFMMGKTYWAMPDWWETFAKQHLTPPDR